MMSLTRAAFLLGLAGFFAAPFQAKALEQPKGTPILEVGGNIQVKNRGDSAVFDRAMLEAMKQQIVETTTPWDNGRVRYEGVAIADLMSELKASGRNVRVLALNDYATVIPTEDFTKFKVILAIKRDGKYMPIREKGPLFVIYPFESDPELQSQVYYARSAWQVKSIEVQN
jgi:hypothetical protein